MKIVRTYRPDYGGLEVFTDVDDTPVYLARGTPAYVSFEKTGEVDLAFVQDVIDRRVAGRAEAEKIAAVDAAIQAELAKRMASVDYSKTGAKAVTAVFGTLSTGGK